MKSNQMRQYTLRGLPRELDHILRRKAREKGTSLNEATLEALRRGVGLSEESVSHHDLDSLIGTWREDAEFEKALQVQDRVDPALWS